MKLALAYSTKDAVELTKQSLPILARNYDYANVSLWWCDGSTSDEGRKYFETGFPGKGGRAPGIVGGADAAIAWKLTTLLADSNNSYVGLVENDVVLDEDWLVPTMELFSRGKQDGLQVGAVSARSYVDRVLIQRDGYAIMHNCGAGHIIFTREAAELVLRSFRTQWWPDNRKLFAQLSGIDLATHACFGGREQFVTTDWGWEAQLARHGLATLALTPAKCQMIGQVPSLAEQGLRLHDGFDTSRWDDTAFKKYAANLHRIRKGVYKLDGPGIIHSQNGGQLFFSHQVGHIPEAQWQGNLDLKWSQGFGPFAYRAGAGGASLTARISGSCSYLISGGDVGASAAITDIRSGFNARPDLPPEQGSFTEILVPGGPVPRTIEMKLPEGSVFYGIQTTEPQMLDTSFRFDWSQLPEAT